MWSTTRPTAWFVEFLSDAQTSHQNHHTANLDQQSVSDTDQIISTFVDCLRQLVTILRNLFPNLTNWSPSGSRSLFAPTHDLADFFATAQHYLLSKSYPELTSVLLAGLVCLVAFMSWSQRLSQLSGRWSPFARSPTTENPPAQVSDADYSYITADDIKNGDYDRGSGPPRDTDLLTLKNKRTTYPIHFPAYSIDRGELTIRDVREQASKKTGFDVRRIKLLYRGKNLKDDSRTCREEGLREGADIMCVTSDSAAMEPPSDSDSEETGPELDGAAASDQPKRKRNRNRNKKKKGKKRPDATDSDGLAVPGSETSRAPSPKPPSTPATPLDKLNAINDALQRLIPQCSDFMAHPPADTAKREFEHKRLSETILTQVLLKLDAVESDEQDVRMKRKDLVKETQRVLNALDAANK